MTMISRIRTALPSAKWPQLTPTLQIIMDNLREKTNKQRPADELISNLSRLSWPSLLWRVLFKDTLKQIQGPNRVQISPRALTDASFKTHILHDCMNVMLIYGTHGVQDECTMLRPPALGWVIWDGDENYATVPPWAASANELGKLNALVSACRQFLLLFLGTRGSRRAGREGAMLEIEQFDGITNGFGRQLYDIRCLMANSLKRDKLTARSWNPNNREQYTHIEKIGRMISLEVRLILKDLLKGKERQGNVANYMARRGSSSLTYMHGGWKGDLLHDIVLTREPSREDIRRAVSITRACGFMNHVYVVMEQVNPGYQDKWDDE